MTPSLPLIRRRSPDIVAWALLALGVLAWAAYAHSEVSLLHYDARAHLVVARRVLDSRTPGLKQFGTHWLPLPHLLTFVPLSSDFLYRTGLASSLLSLFSWWGFLLCLRRLLRELRLPSGPPLALAALHPGLLYLAGTPMTEPLFFFLLTASALHLRRAAAGEGSPSEAARAGLWIGLGCLTRYEAWGAAAAGTLMLLLSRGDAPAREGNEAGPRPPVGRWRRTALFAIGPASAIAAFLLYSFWSTGTAAFLAGVDPHRFPLPASPARALVLTLLGLLLQFGWLGVTALGTGLGSLFAKPRHGLSAVAALTLAPLLWVAGSLAFGLGFRPRYLLGALPLLAIGWAATAARLPTRARAVITALLVVQGFVPLFPIPDALDAAARWVPGFGGSRAEHLARRLQRSCPSRLPAPRLRSLVFPWSDHAVLWEACATSLGSEVDRRVARVLLLHDDGRAILAPMAELAGWMHATGLPLERFIHEGNWPEYQQSLRAPGAHAGWIALRLGSELEQELSPRLERGGEFVRIVRAVDPSGYGLVLYWRSTTWQQATLGTPGSAPPPRTVSIPEL
ncbi:MAG: hypothetical protein V3U98_00340 [Acidobacteriota bacterium]